MAGKCDSLRAAVSFIQHRKIAATVAALPKKEGIAEHASTEIKTRDGQKAIKDTPLHLFQGNFFSLTAEHMHVRFCEPKHLIIAFANAVTLPSSTDDWVARNGEESIFALLKVLLPEVGTLWNENIYNSLSKLLISEMSKA